MRVHELLNLVVPVNKRVAEIAINEMSRPEVRPFGIGFVLEELEHLAAIHLKGVPRVTVRGRNSHQLCYVVRLAKSPRRNKVRVVVNNVMLRPLPALFWRHFFM